MRGDNSALLHRQESSGSIQFLNSYSIFIIMTLRDCLSLWDHNYNDVMMGAMVSQIPSLTIVYSTVYSGVDQIKHQSSTSLDFVWGIHRWPVNSPHKWPVTRKIFPFDDVIMPTPRLLIHHHTKSSETKMQIETRSWSIEVFVILSLKTLSLLLQPYGT